MKFLQGSPGMRKRSSFEHLEHRPPNLRTKA